MHITAIIPVGNHMLRLHKLDLRNGMTIDVTHLTQFQNKIPTSSQESGREQPPSR